MNKTRVLDVRPPDGIVDRLYRVVDATVRPVSAVDEHMTAGPDDAPKRVALHFADMERVYRPDRLDLVCAHHVVGDQTETSADRIADIGKEIRRHRTDGTLGLVVVTESPDDINIQPYDFGVHIKPAVTEIIPRLFEALDELEENGQALEGLYGVGKKHVQPTGDATGFEIGSDLAGRRFEPLSVDLDTAAIRESIALGPGQFTRAVVEQQSCSCIECPTAGFDKVFVFGFQPMDRF